MRYICALPNEKKPGRFPELITDDVDAIAAFAKRYDVPGRAVYMCPNPLLPGAQRRCLETVAAIECIFVDIDFKDLEEPPEEIGRRLEQLPLRPSWVRASGGGFHVGYELKEPIERADEDYFERARAVQKRLVACLCGDPAPAHPAALLRMEGTHNSKRGEPVRCETLWASGEPVDLTDIEATIDLLPVAGMFVRRAVNGHDKHPPQAGERKAPTDVVERLGAMRFKGPGDSSIHATQLACTASLLRSGCTLEHVVDEVLQATRRAVAGNPRAAKWDWAEEEHGICRMCADFINGKHPELYILLPDAHRVRWEAALAEGKQPRLVFSRGPIGWHIRGLPGNAAGAETGEEAEGGSKAADDSPPGAQSKKGSARMPFTLRPFLPFDLATLPPRQWLYGRHYQRRTVSATIAPGGFGKTTLCMVEAVAMATCRNLLGEQPTERLRVWYHNGEDSIEELRRRLGAICLHYEIPQEELRDWFFMTSGNEVPLRVANGYSDLKIDEPLVKCIVAEIARNEIDLAMLDPLVTLHSVPEQDNSKMDAVVRIFASITDAQDCAIELAHHTRKLAPGSTDYVASDIRGASAIKDAVRAARMLNQMTEKDAEAVGIQEHERTSYFRVDRVKGNNAPPAKAVWRRFVNVELPNTDEVGVAVPWDFPGQGTPSPEMTAAEQAADVVFMQLLVRLTMEGRTVSEKSGANYAPHVFSQEREAKAAKLGKRPLAEAMRRLFRAKRIRVELSDRKGREVHRLVVA
jgi:RecA-family ATPase